MKKFTLLIEELTDDQEHYLWNTLNAKSYNASSKHKRLFNSYPNKLNSNRIILPLSTTTLNDKVDPQLKIHLMKHGWDINNYRAGLASRNTIDRDGNNKLEVRKIGKVLQQTGGDKVNHSQLRDRLIKGSDGKPVVGDDGRMKSEKVKQSLSDFYNADPVRASSKSDHNMVISRDSYDIGGMTSGRAWEDDSCMRLPSGWGDDGGSNHEKIKNDLTHGTLVAYATKQGDDDLEDPVGRVLIKRYKSTKPINGRHHYIYRPEKGTYGDLPDGFKDHVESLMKKHYPIKPETKYELEDGLYSDGRRNIEPIKVGLHTQFDGEINNYNEHGQLHDYVGKDGIKQPAIKKKNGSYIHYKNGLEHSDDDTPSSRHIDGDGNITDLYQKNGELHRDNDLPAEITTDKKGNVLRKAYHFGGLLHRDDNEHSVIETPSKGHTILTYHRFGLEHNEHGFSKVEKQPDGGQLYERKINGVLHSPDNTKPAQKTINYTRFGKLMNGELYRNELGSHRTGDLPALDLITKTDTETNHKKEYCINGIVHRDGDKPAYINKIDYPNGDHKSEERYYKHGKLTREDGLPHTIITHNINGETTTAKYYPHKEGDTTVKSATYKNNVLETEKFIHNSPDHPTHIEYGDDGKTEEFDNKKSGIYLKKYDNDGNIIQTLHRNNVHGYGTRFKVDTDKNMVKVQSHNLTILKDGDKFHAIESYLGNSNKITTLDSDGNNYTRTYNGKINTEKDFHDNVDNFKFETNDKYPIQYAGNLLNTAKESDLPDDKIKILHDFNKRVDDNKEARDVYLRNLDVNF